MKKVVNDIVVVGAGASSLSFLHSLVNKGKPYEHFNIIVIDKDRDYGCGNAYKDDVSTNLLNTKAGYITIDKERKGDFFNWLNKNESNWRSDFPNLEVTEDSYLPRPLFGAYMRDKFDALIKDSLSKNVRISTIKGEVINVHKISNLKYTTHLSCGLELESNVVILATGTSFLTKDVCKLNDNIFNSPYPLKKRVDQIDKDDSVLIIGASLSALDTIVALKDNGHKGRITIHSRSCTFPCVRGTQTRYANQFLNINYIEQNNIKINFENLKVLFDKEMENYLKENSNVELANESFAIKNCIVGNLKEYLLNELTLASKPRPWQAILYDTNSILSYIWNLLADDERKLFMKHHQSYAMAMRVSIPELNARKLIDYIDEGNLEFTSGSCVVGTTAENEIKCTLNGNEQVYDKVIYATGSPRDLTLSDSILFRNLNDSEITGNNEYGGISVCKNTFQILTNNGHINEGFFALGEITNGTHLFNSALDIIVSHSSKCSELVLSKISA